MQKQWQKGARCLFLFCALCVLLTACSGGGIGDVLAEVTGGAAPEFSNPDAVYAPPPVLMPTYVGGNEVVADNGEASAVIDMTNATEGYVGAKCTAPVDAVFRVTNGSMSYPYRLKTDGEMQFFPLAMGSGSYTLTVFLHIEGTSYSEFLTGQTSVDFSADDTLPFRWPSPLVNYTPTSQAVALSYELAAHASTPLEVVQQVYYWVENNIEYDTSKVDYARANTDYLPDLDQVLADGKGICYDYAALVAAMLRANGIPCQLIMGDVNTPDGAIVHAWNLIYTEETGWIAVEIKATAGQWQRVDLTFAASEDPSVTEFIGDGSNYAQLYVH